MLYIAEALNDEHNVQLPAEAKDELEDFEKGVLDRRSIFEKGVLDRRSISASAHVESPQRIEVTLVTDDDEQKLKRFLKDNKGVVERMEWFEVQETVGPKRRPTSFTGKLVFSYKEG